MISFPREVYKEDEVDDSNPSISLFGRRFCDDQQVLDVLSEFLLVASSPKKVFDKFDGFFPANEDLNQWREESKALLYYPRCRINLKLFSFLSSSPLATRHPIHREHADELNSLLSQKIDLESSAEKREFLQILNNLFLGFWGTGSKRTWCAQSFFPFCRSTLCAEVVWKQIPAKREHLVDWEDMLSKFGKCFGLDQHVVLCRGGEALYLQICNALTQTEEEIDVWIDKSKKTGSPIELSEDERNPQMLHDSLEELFAEYFAQTPQLDKIMDFVDSKVDAATAETSDTSAGEPRSSKCGWIPRESWKEGYLFAVEVKRILAAKMGVMETADMLMIACAMQIMRTLAAQSYRHTYEDAASDDAVFNYRILLCDALSRKRKLKKFSSESLGEVIKTIQQAIRTPETIERIEQKIAEREPNQDKREKKFQSIYRDADDYGFKLYRKIGKSIGLIVPQTGRWMRYTLNDRILRYLVVTLVPGERMTLETFKKQMEAHHGFVFDLNRLAISPNWAVREKELSGTDSSNNFLEQMLDASGILVRLSDSCSLVKNPFVNSANGEVK